MRSDDALHEIDRLHKQNKQDCSTRGKYFKELLVALENTYKWTRRGFDVTRRMGKWYMKNSWEENEMIESLQQ